ncbi:phage baseplate assembly protein V [Lacrimispora sp.]|uniref:phage baseplate assembly protein V n=1 Tax=Lacrimispora sp. TaxID=2719234 RepID=UPI0039912288
MMNKEMITCGEIIIEPFHLKEIHEIKINRKINEHVFFEASGRIDEEDKDYYSHEINFGTELVVKHTDGNILFRGLLTQVEVKHQGAFYSVCIQGCSYTVLMDITEKTRPFHDVAKTYTDLFQWISSEYSGANVIINDIYQEEVQQLFMQYKETDWAFLKRLASQKSQGLFAGCTSIGPAYYAGTPNLHRDMNQSEGEFQVKKDLKSYKEAVESSEFAATDAGYITYTVCMENWLDLGEEITYRGMPLWVKSAYSVLEHAVLVHYYELCVKVGLYQKKAYNELLSGISVKGVVRAVSRDCVKIQVEEKTNGQKVDKLTDQGAGWFPYSTVYASKDGSGWYCMPEIGDKVRLIFPDSDEKNAYSTGSISEYQPKSSEKDRMADYKNRYIRNPQGMEVDWSPEQINISSNGACVATLDQNGVLTLSAKSKIILQSEGNIVIESGDQIKVNAAHSIQMICGGKGEINISKEGIIELKGNEVYTN